VIAPDKFKGTLGASQVAAAMAKGARAAFPAAAMDLRPVADGGEGTLEALLMGVGGRVRTLEVSGPLDRPCEAEIAWLADGRVGIEMAQASGLTLVDPYKRRALEASSRGTGEAIRAALEAGAEDIVIGVGGSASTDGGTGAATAVGWRFLDARGRDLPPGGGAVAGLSRIEGSEVMSGIAGASIVAACDVDNPLLGERGAARAFGPQKGADSDDVALLEQSMAVLAEKIRVDLGLDVADHPGAGAGGGLGAGLIAFFGARAGRGFEIVAEATELRRAIGRSELVITGEGRLDDSSLEGKAPVSVARMSASAGVTCVAVAGEVWLDPSSLRKNGVRDAASLVEKVGKSRALEDTAGSIAEVTGRLLREKLLGERHLASPHPI
jgi:glycerate 2-kinase